MLTTVKERRHELSLARENQRLQHALVELSILNDLATAIGGLTDSGKVMDTIIRRSMKAVNAEQGTIALLAKSDARCTDTLVRASCEDVPASGKFHVTDGILGWILLHRKPLVIDSVATDERTRDLAFDSSIRTILAVPLVTKSNVIGVLSVVNKRTGGTFDFDDQRLLSIIATQSAQVIENARLSEKEQDLVFVREQIRLAAVVQKHLLPAATPVLPGYELAGSSVAAQEIGGDYFDFIPLSRGRLAICLGDVSGKGVPASLLMANVQAMMRILSTLDLPTAECIARANELLYRCTTRERFVTFFYSVLDPATGALSFCNAGHNPPILIRDGTCTRLQTRGLILGMRPDFVYVDDAVCLEKDDVLVVYSDGVTEAVNPDDSEFGDGRLIADTMAVRHESAQGVLDAILDSVRRYAAGMSQSDDITIVVLKKTA